MEDTGLQEGANSLHEQQLLLDFTIKVQGQELKVHKFVLASVSDYFRAMICGSMSESTTDMVELKDGEAEHVSNLIDFIYTGSSYHIDTNPKEMFELAVYFQMPKVIRKCRQTLCSTLGVNNCVDLLSTFKKYSMDHEVGRVSHFIKGHKAEVMQHYRVEDMTPDVVQIILENWTKSEWDMFQFLRSWISADFDNRKTYLSDFMSHVRFSIMPPEQIKEIREGFLKAEGSWMDLVEKAFVYNQQTTLHKVADDSNQSKFRFTKSPFLLSLGKDCGDQLKFWILVKDEDKASDWEECKPVDSPQVTGKIPFVLEVNNFLITCSEFCDNQTWQVFDPLALTWTKMPNMPTPKDGFAMVYHDKRLYVLGGSTGLGSQTCITDMIDEYSFETNSWSSSKKLPVPVKNHSACVLNGVIYVSGGIDAGGKTARMDCFDIATQKWDSKAPLYQKMANHKMSVMTLNRRQFIVVIHTEVILGHHWLFNSGIAVRYYNPVFNQWVDRDLKVDHIITEECGDDFDYPFKEISDIAWSTESMMLVNGNSIFLLNLRGEELRVYEKSRYSSDDYYSEDEREDEFVKASGLCAKWRVEDYEYEKVNMAEADVGSDEVDPSMIDILEFATADFPRSYSNVVGGVLAFSPDIIP